MVTRVSGTALAARGTKTDGPRLREAASGHGGHSS
jgi:hypothetical protein